MTTYINKQKKVARVNAWRWQPKFSDGKLQPEAGSVRDEANAAWLHPSGVSTPDSGGPSSVTTPSGVERPKIGDYVVALADGTRRVMSPEAFGEEYAAE